MSTKNTSHKPKSTVSLPFGFTLVELIVVITILVILGTIGFLQIGGMSNSARDSDRITTMKNMEKSLDIFAIKTGSYPTPEGTLISGLIYGKVYSTIGVIGDNISRNIKINKTPLDPLSKTNYTYGVSSDNRYYQIAATLENSLSYENPIIPTVHAASYQAKVSGNYPKYMKFVDGTGVYLANVPSLIFNNTGTTNLLSTGTYFVVDKKQNLPYKIDTSVVAQNIQADTLIKDITKSTTATLTGVNITNLSGALFDAVFTGSTLASFNLNGGDITNITAIKDSIKGIVAGSTIASSGSGEAVDSDPYWANVVFLMHMNGTNGGTTFTDNSTPAKTTSYYAHVNTSTAQSKFGGSSALFDGTDDYISSSGSSLVLGTGDFTIETWLYKTTNDGKTPIFQTTAENSAGSLWFGQYSNTWYIRINGLGNDISFSYDYTPKLNKWTHMSLVRNSGVITAYIDGVSVASGTRAQDITQNTIRLGYTLNAGVFLNGYMDDYRITKGVARYTSNFTPPTKEFPNN